MNHISEKDERRALIYSGNADTASGRGRYGGVSTEDNGNPPDLASTFYHQSSIFHTMRKGSIVVSPPEIWLRNSDVDLISLLPISS